MNSSSIESVVNYALSTLHNLLLHLEHAKLEILRCGGCQKMVGLLNSTNPKFLAILTDCLHMLAFNNEEVKVKQSFSICPFSSFYFIQKFFFFLGKFCIMDTRNSFFVFGYAPFIIFFSDEKANRE